MVAEMVASEESARCEKHAADGGRQNRRGTFGKNVKIKIAAGLLPCRFFAQQGVSSRASPSSPQGGASPQGEAGKGDRNGFFIQYIDK